MKTERTSTNLSDANTRSALVVEDEVMILNFFSSTLENMGFEVVSANNGTEAMQAVSGGAEFSVAFVDLGLPDISGLELISELKKMQPHAAIVIASGYGDMAKRDMESVDEDSLVVLTKPYTEKNITKVLNDLGITI